jgi:hypothetical protein
MVATSNSSMLTETEHHMNDIAVNYHELDVLAQARMGAAARRLRSALHVTCTQVVLEGLDLFDGILEN